MAFKRYKITCLSCKRSDTVLIEMSGKPNILYESGPQTNLTSARWRKDSQWGFECICGNYDLLAQEEKPDADKLISGSPTRILQIAKILKQKPRMRFKMELYGGLPGN